MNDDELEKLLEETPGEVDYNPSFRIRLLQETRARVRRRARKPRTALMLRWAIAYGLGVITAVGLSGYRANNPVETLDRAESHESSGYGKAETDAPAHVNPSISLDPEALAFALRAASDSERPDLLKAAGDRVLVDQGDVERAAAYYELYLDESSTDARAERGPRDTWLLAAMRSGVSVERR